MLPATSSMLPGNMLLVAGNMLPVSRQHRPMYPATDGQQTGNNFVAGNMLLVPGNMLLKATCCLKQATCSSNMLPQHVQA